MNLLTETYRFARWTAGVTRRFLRVRPWSTVAVTLASAVDGVLQLLAFLVPLKIILLAASPGIPRYFPFIDPAHKVPWIIGLCIGAVGAYLTSLLLNTLSDRWSRSAGRDVLRGANDLAVHAQEEAQVQKAFTDFTSVLASILFLGAAGLVLTWANLDLTIFLVVMIGLLAVVSAVILAGNEQPPSRLKAWVMEKSGQYLGFWRVITFFGALGVIIHPFLTGQGGNIFLAIIGFIMLRQMLGNITGAISKATGLVRRRPGSDALIYRSQQVADGGREDRFHTFRALFAPGQRDPMIAEALEPVLGDGVAVRTRYADPVPAAVKRFDVEVMDGAADLPRFEVRVFPANCQDQVANANFLFRYVPRERLHAPPARAQFDYHGYTFVIQEAGNGERCQAGKNWPPVQEPLIGGMLSIVPPAKLVRSYRHTRRMLPDRLTQTFCERLWIGVDSEQEAQSLAAFLASREDITRMLRRQPIALCNPEITPPNVINAPDQPLVMAWGKWSLEPIGAAMARHGWGGAKAGEHLQSLKQYRGDLAARDWAGDLQLGAQCHTLEQAIIGERYKAGLQAATEILRTLEASDAASTGGQPLKLSKAAAQ